MGVQTLMVMTTQGQRCEPEDLLLEAPLELEVAAGDTCCLWYSYRRWSYPGTVTRVSVCLEHAKTLQMLVSNVLSMLTR